MLEEEVHLHVTKSMITKYLREECVLKYKVVKPITSHHNLFENKLKR
jgi:hypothetical protein